MADLRADDITRKMINLLQIDFPLTAMPFAVIAERLGIKESAVIRHIYELKQKDIVRLIGPVIEARKLGYQTTLVAMNVPSNKLKRAEEVISAHPSVSHAYEREHHFNMWVTFAAPASFSMDREIVRLSDAVGSDETMSLPALRVFKIGAYFGMGSEDDESGYPLPGRTNKSLPRKVVLTPQEKLVLNILQQDLPLVHRPFTEMAKSAGLKTSDFLAVCSSLLERGVLRRYSASINHHKAGYQANAMTCWLAPASAVERCGNIMADMRQVSHCYERRTYSSWPYNLYTMLHARSREACRTLIQELSEKTGLDNYLVLFSTREFKKTRIKYLV